MAKAKPKAAAGKAKTAVLAAQMKAKAKKPNPFELKGSKGHFDTIGRRVSGKKQNVIQARQEAVNRRKKTLLVEYRQLRKANTFVDRRFGETDPELTEADKGLARLQAQRMREERKKKKRGSKFTLSEGDGGGGEGDEGLTHLGRSLADDLRDFMDCPEFDDLDEEMVEDLVAQYHFGGGGAGAEGEAGEEGGAARGPDGKPKTRKQVMEEIIAKSRMYRALKAKQREEDEAALEAINEEFRQLVASAALSKLVKAPGENKALKVKADNPNDAAYDVAARELAFESKGAAGDRTLSPEELLEKERQRLEKLERERLKRMRGGDGADEEEDEEEEEEDEEEDGGRRGGKRRREQPSGDALGDNYDSEGGDTDEGEEEEDDGDGEAGEGGRGVSELDKRRMKAAAGNHPLQESLRAAAAALAAKYGVEAPKNPYLEEDEDEDEDEEGESEDEGAEGEEEEEGESGSGEDEGEEEGAAGPSSEGEDEEDGASDEEQLEQRRNPVHPPSTSRPGDVAANGTTAAVKKKEPARAAAAAKPLEGPLDLPYTIPLPSSYNEFAALVGGRPAEDLATAIARIRAFNAVALATDNKRKMQELYGILVQHFAMEAGRSPLPVASLDVLTRVILELTPEVPYYAATVARARLNRMSDQLTAALAALGGAAAREAAGAVAATAANAATSGSPWPGARVVLQLKLFSLLFPTSDRRHPVLTPAALLIGKYLNQCVVSNPHEAAVGLCLCGLATHMAAPAHRTTPEVLVFLRDCLAAFAPPGGSLGLRSGAASGAEAAGSQKQSGAKRKDGGSGAAQQQQQVQQQDPDAFVRFAPGILALSGKAAATATEPPAPPPLDLYGVLGGASSAAADPRVRGDNAFKLGLLRVALCAVRRCAALAAESGLVCFEQLFAPLRAAVTELGRIEGRLPGELRSLRTSVLQQLVEASATCVAARRPLAHPGRAARSGAGAAPGVIPASAVREFNPRFEDGFVSGRDYDPDRQRAEARRLKRALVKERRGAIRELRRDAVFMAEERDRETARVDAERLDSERRFYSELQRQEADLRSGGQAGMNPHLKKKKK